MKKLQSMFAVFILFLWVSGCRNGSSKMSESKSPIVQQVEVAGSGDISQASPQSIGPWFDRQPLPFKQKIRSECADAQKSADAVWNNTSEGILCQTVFDVCFMGGCEPKTPLPELQQRTPER